MDPPRGLGDVHGLWEGCPRIERIGEGVEEECHVHLLVATMFLALCEASGRLVVL